MPFRFGSCAPAPTQPPPRERRNGLPSFGRFRELAAAGALTVVASGGVPENAAARAENHASARTTNPYDLAVGTNLRSMRSSGLCSNPFPCAAIRTKN
jgi:hypothetical protein